MKKKMDDIPPGGNPEQPDPLRSIGDIGPEYAKALHQIGIHQPVDMLRYTPEQLAQELLEKTGKKVNLSRIHSKDWFGQARRLVEAHSPGMDVGDSLQPGDKTIHTEQAQPAAWHERGMFTIKFLSREEKGGKPEWRILVYDERGPGPEVPFEGFNPAPWSQWIIDQMKLDIADAEERQIPLEPPVTEPEITRFLTQADQLRNSSIVEFAFNDVDVNRSPEDPENRLEVQAGFHLLGDGIEDGTRNRTPYRMTFHLIDLEYQTSNPISSIRGRLEPGQEAYQVRDSFPIPGTGKYELHTTLIFEDGAAIFCDGPIFNVVQETGENTEENSSENARE